MMAEKKYIEREAARKYILDEYPLLQRDRLMRTIDDIPAADVRPVGCGYILKHYHPVACSNCHRAGMKGWNYCPNCGADMREES